MDAVVISRTRRRIATSDAHNGRNCWDYRLHRARPPLQSRLRGVVFSNGVQQFKLGLPYLAGLATLDAEWRSLRPEDAPNAHWDWPALMRHARDRFSLLDGDGNVIGLWCSGASSPRKYENGAWYRLDFMEVRPDRRESSIGAAMVAAIGARAIEMSATGIIIESLPESAPFWRRLGATERTMDGWRPGRDLLPFVVETDLLNTLKEVFDEGRAQASSKSEGPHPR